MTRKLHVEIGHLSLTSLPLTVMLSLLLFMLPINYRTHNLSGVWRPILGGVAVSATGRKESLPAAGNPLSLFRSASLPPARALSLHLRGVGGG